MSASKQRKESILERKIYKELKLAIGKCERCGCQEDLTIHHLFRWGNYLWRTNLTNLICVCRGCHDWVEQPPAGKQWVQDKYADRIRALQNDKARKSDIDILISIWRDRGIISRTRSNEFLTDYYHIPQKHKKLQVEKNGKIYEYDREGFQPID